MNMLPSKIHDHNNDLDYMLVGDYYLPELKPLKPRHSVNMAGCDCVI